MLDEQKTGGLNALPVEEVADLLGVTSKTVRNWINKEGLEAVSDGRRRVLDWRGVLEWYIQRRIAESGNDGNGSGDPAPGLPENLEQAETRKTIADADLKELKLAQLRGQLVPADEVGRNIARVATAIKTKLEGLPSSLALRLVGKSDRAEVQQILQDAVYRIKLELSVAGKKPEASAPEPEDEEE